MFKQVGKNKYGFYSVRETPAPDQLTAYYAEKYYQEDKGSYANSYSEEEIKYLLNKIEQKYLVIQDIAKFDKKAKPQFLDIGCGEGWSLQYFAERSWDILGLDYSDFGCKNHNPGCLDKLLVGDIYPNIKSLIETRRKFDVILLDNVLEHVTDPLLLLRDCRKLINPGGTLVIEVPNDFSLTQQHLYNQGYITEPFWVVRPDHISYFNAEGLRSVCNEAGWDSRLTISDFPIDFNLFNERTNYVKDRTVGKSCHKTRVAVENFLYDTHGGKVNELYRILGELGLGRQIIGFYQPKSE